MKKKFKVNRIIIIGIVIYILYAFISRQQVLKNNIREAQHYQDLKTQEEQRYVELQEKRDNINSDEFIEETARNKLGMYLPNERVYIDISK